MAHLIFGKRIAGISLMSCAIALLASADPVNPAFGAGDDAFISRQSAALLAEVGKTLDAVPPSCPEPRERALALRLLAAVLHDTHSPTAFGSCTTTASWCARRLSRLRSIYTAVRQSSDGMARVNEKLWTRPGFRFPMHSPSAWLRSALQCSSATNPATTPPRVSRKRCSSWGSLSSRRNLY